MSATTIQTTMPYNTRRKSLSLSELGITAPKRSRTISHPSPPDTVIDTNDLDRPSKKSKRSHTSNSPSVGTMSPPRTTNIRTKLDKRPSTAQLSPPLSPVGATSSIVDVEGINDEIVVCTIRQLERCGNRPHLVKELGAALAPQIPLVERSANPSALISSRLTAYLNRTWPVLSPCPLAKDLSPVHPRRLYFYLTTTPHQPIPATVDAIPAPARIISPSLSSASAEEEERYTRQRQALSPSPEVDLSSPELEDHHDEGNPVASFASQNSLARESSAVSSLSNSRRGGSPQLEKEERDFKQTANALFEQAQQRRNSQEQDTPADGGDMDATTSIENPISMTIEGDSEEHAALRNRADAAALFGREHLGLPKTHSLMEFSSPIIQPHTEDNSSTSSSVPLQTGIDHLMALDSAETAPDAGQDDMELFAWDDLQCPETVELDELDNMFDDF